MARGPKTKEGSALRFREARPRDGLAMWRLRRTRRQDDAMSPFFYMAVLQRVRHSCVAAEDAGELVGYVVAQRLESRPGVRVFDLVVGHGRDTATVAGGLLAKLVELPTNLGVEYVEAVEGAQPAVGALLAAAGVLPVELDGWNAGCRDDGWGDGDLPPAERWAGTPTNPVVTAASGRGSTA